MKKWFKDNLLQIVLSSLLILAPMVYGILFWNKLPDTFITHWGADGVADGSGGKAFAVFGIPAIFLAVNFLCFFCTYFDKHNREKNQKAMRVIFWIMPTLSVLINCIIYKTATSDTIEFFWLFPVMFGVLFVVMGNYMPKVGQNRTLGVKISWTLGNEENWNKTHRLTGRVWVTGGAVILVSAILPLKWSLIILFIVTFAMILIPYLYSYSIYRKHVQQGVSYKKPTQTKAEKNAVKFSSIMIPFILVGVMILMFTGTIEYKFTDSALEIDPSYGAYSTVGYEFIDEVEYRDDFDFGFRTMGFSSAKLSVGKFNNDEFGNYTLYAYTGSGSAVVIKSGEHIMVITGKDNSETKALFNQLSQNVK